MGAPIRFFAEFSGPVDESTIEWHTKGHVVFQASNKFGTRRITRDTLDADWNNIPLVFNNTNDHDSLYMTFQNNNEISNKVVIYMVNHAPVLDSVKLNGILLGRNVENDTINVIRLHANPTVKCTLKVWKRDIDIYDKPVFFIEGLPDTIQPQPDSAMDSTWVFHSWPADTFFRGHLRIEDGRGGIIRYPLEIVDYSEVHSFWVASTYGINSTSIVNKLTGTGRKIFSLNRFQQVKFLSVLPADRQHGTEAVWVVDNTQRAYGTGIRTFSDTVFVLDDDGRILKSFGGFKSQIKGLSLDAINNIAYVIDSNTVKKITFNATQPAVAFTATGGLIEAVDCNAYNIGELWIGVSSTATGKTKKFVIHTLGGTVIDTLRRSGSAAWDSLKAIKSIAVSPRNNLVWVGDDVSIVVADMNTDTIRAVVDGCQTPYVFADQSTLSPYCWISDAGFSRLLRLTDGWDTTTALPPRISVDSARARGLCAQFGTALNLMQPRSLALDYRTDSRHPDKTLWVADYGSYKILKLNAVTGAQIAIQSNLMDLELGRPEAISVNVGTW